MSILMPSRLRPPIESARIVPTARATPPLVRRAGPWTLDLDFTRDELDPRIVVNAPDPKTYWDQNGVLQVAAPNTWPLEFDPVTGERLGRSVWGARTNLIQYSQEWYRAITGVTATLGIFATAGDPTLFSELDAATEHFVERWFPTTEGIVYSFSGLTHIPPVGRDITFRLVVGFPDSHIRVARDGTLSIVGSAINRARIALLPGGRFYWEFTATAHTTTVGSRLRMQPVLAGGMRVYTGNPDMTYRGEWMQAEQGAFPSPYIPTEDTAVTRGGDLPWMPIGDWYNPQEGTFLCEWSGMPPPASNASAFLLNGSPPNNDALSIARNQGGSIAARIRADAVTNDAILNLYGDTLPFQRSVIAYSDGASGAAAYNNGFLGRDWPHVKSPKSIFAMRFGYGWPSGTQLNGHIRNIRYYPRRLSNAELQALSALQ